KRESEPTPDSRFVFLRTRRIVDELDFVVGRANEVAQNSDVGTVDADASSVHWETKLLCLLEIHASIVKFGQTKALRGQNAIQPRGIHRARRAVTPPGASRYLVELMPIAFLPSGHSASLLRQHLRLTYYSQSDLLPWMHGLSKRFTRPHPLAVTIRYFFAGKRFSSATVSNTLRGHLLRGRGKAQIAHGSPTRQPPSLIPLNRHP